ncbi:hypothetical protein JB92DRAFT_2919037 [Gautieria morchelliformis]|nr:hypothetical protein JB92DRAFT_2919037 [Gautieria morchelliformis]
MFGNGSVPLATYLVCGGSTLAIHPMFLTWHYTRMNGPQVWQLYLIHNHNQPQTGMGPHSGHSPISPSFSWVTGLLIHPLGSARGEIWTALYMSSRIHGLIPPNWPIFRIVS